LRPTGPRSPSKTDEPPQVSRSDAKPSEGHQSGGPPPLRPFGLVLHHDGSWTHEGHPIQHAKLREHFDRSVEYLPAEQKYVVTLRHFRGEITVEEAGFFVRSFEPGSARIALSDRSEETLDPATLSVSPIDGALLCRVKRALAPQVARSQPKANEVHQAGLLARFMHAAQAELLHAVDATPSGMRLRVGGEWREIPDL
jgi:hypothetical protein